MALILTANGFIEVRSSRPGVYAIHSFGIVDSYKRVYQVEVCQALHWESQTQYQKLESNASWCQTPAVVLCDEDADCVQVMERYDYFENPTRFTIGDVVVDLSALTVRAESIRKIKRSGIRELHLELMDAQDV